MLYPDDIAVKDVAGEFTYFQLYITAKKLAIQISNFCGSIYICNQLQFHYEYIFKCIIYFRQRLPIERGISVLEQRTLDCYTVGLLDIWTGCCAAGAKSGCR